jgi:hypothetical protein
MFTRSTASYCPNAVKSCASVCQYQLNRLVLGQNDFDHTWQVRRFKDGVLAPTKILDQIWAQFGVIVSHQYRVRAITFCRTVHITFCLLPCNTASSKPSRPYQRVPSEIYHPAASFADCARKFRTVFKATSGVNASRIRRHTRRPPSDGSSSAARALRRRAGPLRRPRPPALFLPCRDAALARARPRLSHPQVQFARRSRRCLVGVVS